MGAAQRKAFERIRASSADAVRIQGKRVNARWFREFLDYDPRPGLERVAVPVLAVVGEHEMQVPPTDTEEIRRLVTGSCEAHVIPGLSHLLRPDPEDKGPRDYRRALRQLVSPVVRDLVVQWVDDRTSR